MPSHTPKERRKKKAARRLGRSAANKVLGKAKPKSGAKKLGRQAANRLFSGLTPSDKKRLGFTSRVNSATPQKPKKRPKRAR